MKTCTHCKQLKEESEFYKDVRAIDGLYADCKVCRKRFKSAMTPTQKIRMRKWRLINLEKRILASIRCRCKKKNIPFNIDESDIIIPEYCPVLGIRLKPKLTSLDELLPDTTSSGCSPSVDRIDPNKGYIKGNVCVISHRANCIKNDGTIEEHQKVIKYMEIKDLERLST